MKSFLIGTLSAAAICGFAALTPAASQATAPGRQRLGAGDDGRLRSIVGHRLRSGRHHLLAFGGSL